MGNLPDDDGTVQSNLADDANSDTVTFTLPARPQFEVQSVVATIDNGAGGTIKPTLTIADSAGVVIAKRRQASSIPAGDTGTATWALRLGDDGGGGTPTFGTEITNNVQAIGPFGIGQHTIDWVHSAGDTLLNYSTPDLPTVIAAGLYSVTLSAVSHTPVAGGFVSMVLDFNVAGQQGFAATEWPLDNDGSGLTLSSCALTQYLPAGTSMDGIVQHDQAVAVTFAFTATIQKVSWD